MEKGLSGNWILFLHLMIEMVRNRSGKTLLNIFLPVPVFLYNPSIVPICEGEQQNQLKKEMMSWAFFNNHGMVNLGQIHPQIQVCWEEWISLGPPFVRLDLIRNANDKDNARRPRPFTVNVKRIAWILPGTERRGAGRLQDRGKRINNSARAS